MLVQHLTSSERSSPVKASSNSYKWLRRALRYAILLGITGLSFRELAHRVADSAIFQWFTHTAGVDGVRPVAKSTIKRFEKIFPCEVVAKLIHDCSMAVANPEGAQELLYSETALVFDEIFADTTCVKSNIHFPVDWILLRDATRTLIKAIELIRSQGLRHRMGDPKKFLRDMNKLCPCTQKERRKEDA